MTLTSFSSASTIFFGPGLFPITRTSVMPEMAPVTLPPNCSMHAFSLCFPTLSPEPPPRFGQVPDRTNLNPSRLSWTAPSPAVGVMAVFFSRLPRLLGVEGLVTVVVAVRFTHDLATSSFSSGGRSAPPLLLYHSSTISLILSACSATVALGNKPVLVEAMQFNFCGEFMMALSL